MSSDRHAAAGSPGIYDLGSWHREVTTTSKDTQDWFDQGLIWTYAFNHEQAVECFDQAVAYDSTCAMAYWGSAYALGPNYNKPWEIFDEQEREKVVSKAHQAAMQAKAYASATSPVEQALIHALEFRYPQDQPAEDCSVWNVGYAKAMGTVYADFPNDLDVATLYADALMLLTPWKFWDLDTGKADPDAQTLEIKSILDLALAQDGGLQHPGLLHLYIHLMEMSGIPESAMTVADHLRGLVPDAGHLHHMPTHLDILCGDYRRAIASNSDAICADQKFLARKGAKNFYTLYRCHNYHFRIYGAMFVGQSKVALETVTELEASIPEELLRTPSPPMADWLEGFLAMRVHALIRFGRWTDILDMKLPQDQKLYCVTTAMMHYAKAVAMAATANVHDAVNERIRFQKALKKVAPTRTLFHNKCTDILAIAGAMLDGEIHYRQGNFASAFRHLRQAVTLDDTLPYDEPWGWMQPARHAYGALLLEQEQVEEAVGVYSADLGMDDTLPRALQHPNNVWALHGYHECLVKLGRMSEARIIEPQLRLALAMADVPIKSSCFCRLNTDHKI